MYTFVCVANGTSSRPHRWRVCEAVPFLELRVALARVLSCALCGMRVSEAGYGLTLRCHRPMSRNGCALP
jgi:hypothetical protein